jgi:hypothetical protein
MIRLKVIKNQDNFRFEKEVAANKRKTKSIKRRSVVRDPGRVHLLLRGVKVETVDGIAEAEVVVVIKD